MINPGVVTRTAIYTHPIGGVGQHPTGFPHANPVGTPILHEEVPAFSLHDGVQEWFKEMGHTNAFAFCPALVDFVEKFSSRSKDTPLYTILSIPPRIYTCTSGQHWSIGRECRLCCLLSMRRLFLAYAVAQFRKMKTPHTAAVSCKSPKHFRGKCFGENWRNFIVRGYSG